MIDIVSPGKETVKAVKLWLAEFGIAPERVTHTENKAWLAFDATIEEAEGLLRTKHHLFEDPTSRPYDSRLRKVSLS